MFGPRFLRIAVAILPCAFGLFVNISAGVDAPSPGKEYCVPSGRSPSLAFGSGEIAALYSGPGTNGKGRDLYFRRFSAAGKPSAEIRVNRAPGEMSDHGENGPILLAAPDGSHLYAIWNASDPRHPRGNVLKFSRFDSKAVAWSSAVTLNDDEAVSTHSFQGATVGPDGAIYAAWLDRREADPKADYPGGGLHTGHRNMEGTISLYLTRSFDRGTTFSRNIRVAGNICPCCRASLAVSGGNLVVAYRSVEPGDIRDIAVTLSSDRGATWSEPRVAARDNWKINACPHVGPSLAVVGKNLHAAWTTKSGESLAVFVVTSTDGGRTFSPKQKASGELKGATHPFLSAGPGRAALMFQAEGGALYHREVRGDGSLSAISRKLNGPASYATSAFDAYGTLHIGWTATADEKTSGCVL